MVFDKLSMVVSLQITFTGTIYNLRIAELTDKAYFCELFQVVIK